MTNYHFRPEMIPMMRFMVENDIRYEDAELAYFLFPDAQRGDYGFRERVAIGYFEVNVSWLQVSGEARVWAWLNDDNPLGTGNWFEASRCNFETGEVYG